MSNTIYLIKGYSSNKKEEINIGMIYRFWSVGFIAIPQLEDDSSLKSLLCVLLLLSDFKY